MAGNNPKYAWQNGEVIPWEQAVVHSRTEAVMRGASVFEGTRAYASEDKQQLYVFRNTEHMDRLFNTSMKILRLQLPWTADDLTAGMLEMLRANEFHGDVQIRPTVYYGMGEYVGIDPSTIQMEALITAEERQGEPASSLWNGITAKVSSWRRNEDDSMPPRVKAGANYLNSRYAMMEAKVDGYDDVIFLNSRGKVAEGTGACLMMVRGGKVVVPPVTQGLLESITRDTIMELFQVELGIEVVEREIDRTELYISDEVFFCGTGAEIQPIISIDKYPVGSGQTGPVVKQMQELYFGIVRGQNAKYQDWLLPVY